VSPLGWPFGAAIFAAPSAGALAFRLERPPPLGRLAGGLLAGGLLAGGLAGGLAGRHRGLGGCEPGDALPELEDVRVVRVQGVAALAVREQVL